MFELVYDEPDGLRLFYKDIRDARSCTRSPFTTLTAQGERSSHDTSAWRGRSGGAVLVRNLNARGPLRPCVSSWAVWEPRNMVHPRATAFI